MNKLGIKPPTYASIGKHFFTKSCHRQTYQNYEQRRQKLGTFLENKLFKKSKFSQEIGKIQPIFNTEN